MENRHLLLIGQGYVGREIVNMARENGWAVTGVSRSGSNGSEKGDVSDLESMQQLSQRVKPTHVVHCASASGGGVEGYERVYRDGCKNLTEVFPEAEILFTSSTSVYAQVDGSVVDEESETAPQSVTGKLMLEAEQAVLKAGGKVARLAGIYGDGRSYLLRRFFAGDAVIEGDGKRYVNYIHQKDAASACLFLLENSADARIYNVCDSESLSQKDTYAVLSETFSLPMPPFVDKKIASKRGWSNKTVSNKKITSLGWSPTFPRFVDAAPAVAKSLGLTP